MRPTTQIFQKVTKVTRSKVSPTKKITLSDFFPKDTVYFYGYPSGSEAGYVNLDPPTAEEIIAARINLCAGNNIKVVNFSTTTRVQIGSDILSALELDKLDSKQIIVLPSEINTEVNVRKRNILIRDFLMANVEKGMLIMAQPFLDKDFRAHSQIDPKVTVWLNDKKNIKDFIHKDLLPKQYGLFKDGQELSDNILSLKAPVVIKLTSSGGGDGVYLCQTDKEILETTNKLNDFAGTILAEKFITAKRNYGVQFGIPHNSNPINIIGISEQITNPEGEFLGGIVKSDVKIPSVLNPVINSLLRDILPFAKRLGWYGVGCVDVLVDSDNNAYIIDFNFRMTGMSTFLMLRANGAISGNIMSFSGEFVGKGSELVRVLRPLINQSELKLISISKNSDHWRLNGCLSYRNIKELHRNIKYLNNNMIFSKAFESEIISAVDDYSHGE